MDLMRRNGNWTPPPQPSRGGIVVPPRNIVPPAGPAAMGQARLIRFQPLITVMVPDSTAPEASAIQQFSAWFDGASVSEIHFKVEVLQLLDAKLILESAPTIDADVDQWDSVHIWTAPTTSTPGYDVVTAVSSSAAPATLEAFSRYIRWRVEANGADGRVCFRIKAIVGASFTQYAEKPRVV
jgi:hypothetical protein